MYLTVHAAAGLTLAAYTASPSLAFALGLISHFVLDFIPHGDEHLAATHFTRERVMKRLLGAALLDGIVLIIFGLIYIATTPIYNPAPLIAGVAGALAPDVLLAITMITNAKWLEWYKKFHHSIHNLPGHKLTWVQGMFVQVMVFIALWLILI
ncbi:MAG: hypothetical protein AAB657_04885 [Patescibacteria group bacterium]